MQAYDYRPGAAPYVYTIQPTLFFTTKGRPDASIFIDAPHLVAGGWRLSAYADRLQQLAAPYYGVGNTTVYEASAHVGPNPYYYRFGRETRLLHSNDSAL